MILIPLILCLNSPPPYFVLVQKSRECLTTSSTFYCNKSWKCPLLRIHSFTPYRVGEIKTFWTQCKYKIFHLVTLAPWRVHVFWVLYKSGTSLQQVPLTILTLCEKRTRPTWQHDACKQRMNHHKGSSINHVAIFYPFPPFCGKLYKIIK